MSWLLVALIPGLLMLATFGLERVEAGLRSDAMSPADVDDIVDQVKASDVECRPAPAAIEAPRCIHHRLGEVDTLADSFIEPISAPSLPPREYLAHLANTEFRQTRHADRV